MTIKRKRPGRKIEIDLTGPQGNAFFLLGTATRLARQLGLDPEKVTEEMRESNYEHLVQTFDKYFGEHVILYR
jgi:hypothetical protein